MLERDAEKIGGLLLQPRLHQGQGGGTQDRHQGGIHLYHHPHHRKGPQFKVGKVDVKGDLLEDKEDLLKKLEIPKERSTAGRCSQKDSPP